MTTYLTSGKIAQRLGLDTRTPKEWALRGLVRHQLGKVRGKDVMLICLEDCEAQVGAKWQRTRPTINATPSKAHPVPDGHPWLRSSIQPGSRERAREHIAPHIAKIIARAEVMRLQRLARIKALEAEGHSMRDAVAMAFEVTR